MNWKELAKDYNEAFSFNVIPLVNKVPKIDWKIYTTEEMSYESLDNISWNNSTNGIGAISGINELRCLDFDKVNDIDIVYKIAEALGLKKDYCWIVKSGSGKGYHIWFKCADEDNFLDGLGGEKSYYKFNLKETGICDHLELRWKDCQTVLPPSLHQSGNKYEFINSNSTGLPENEPQSIWIGKILQVINEFCVIEKFEENRHDNKSGYWQIETYKTRGMKVLNEYEKRILKNAVNFIKGKINNYDEWYKIGFALASLGEKGRKYFIKISSGNKNYPNDSLANLNKKFDSLLKDYEGDITLGSLFEIAKKHGWAKPLQQFWTITNNRAEINKTALFELLETEGFGKLFFGNEYFFVNEQNNIIRNVELVNIKDFVLEYIEKTLRNKNYRLVKEALLRSARNTFNEGTLEFLKTKEIKFAEDSKEKALFFFENCFVEVTKNKMETQNYTDLQHKIWENQLIKREFYIANHPSDFEIFLSNICRNDESRINALKSAIGFLLHGFKDPTKAKAIIFIDEKLSENAFGRSGKGLVAKGIKELRNMLRMDGKNFSFDKSFPFQAVSLDTQVIFFDDVNKKFNFNKLFSIITEGITIEKKNKNEYRIEFDKTPKILLTTNYTISGSDDSSTARQFVIEFSDYYNAKHEPINDFGKMFFVEWSSEEYNKFDNFMLKCVQYYLKNGLQNYEYVNLIKKKIIDETTIEFEEFMREIKVETEYNKKELYEKFKTEYEDFGQIKQNTFTKWTKVFAELNNYKLFERKSGADRFIVFSKGLKQNENSLFMD